MLGRTLVGLGKFGRLVKVSCQAMLLIPTAWTMAPLSSLKYPPEENSESRFGIRRVQLVQVAKETVQYGQGEKNSGLKIRGKLCRFLRGFSTLVLGGHLRQSRAAEL